VESRGLYYTDGTSRELCDNDFIRNCTLLEVDSALYVHNAQIFNIGDLVDAVERQPIVSLGALNDLILYFDFDFAKAIAPNFPYVVVVLINALLFFGGARNIQLIARKLELDEMNALILYFTNPLMLFAMTSLNKEIVGIFVVSAIARAYLYRRFFFLLISVVLALMTRFAFDALGFILIARYLFPWLKPRYVLLSLGLVVIPAIFQALGGQLGGANAPSFFQYAESLNQQSTAILGFGAQVMAYPFGPFLGWTLIGTVDVLSPMLNLSLYGSYMNGFSVDNFAEQTSSFLFALFGAIVIYRIIRQRFRLLSMAELFLYMFVIVATFPISAHRYLIASWPLLILAFLQYDPQMRSKRANISRPVLA
jgi:hypothetical protein